MTAVAEKANIAAVTVAGEPALCDPLGVLVFTHLRLLVVSDLHLEKGSSFARRGALLPPYDTAATLLRLQAAVDRHAPRTVVCLGDSFHDRGGPDRLPDPYRDALAALMAGRDWFWVKGNHDPDPPVGLGGTSVEELAIGPLVMRHEPCAHRGDGEIAGHLHPCARIVQRGRSVRRRCFAGDGRRIILPAFGSYTGSLNVLDRAFQGLLRAEQLVAHMIGADAVYPVAGRMLRPG